MNLWPCRSPWWLNYCKSNKSFIIWFSAACFSTEICREGRIANSPVPPSDFMDFIGHWGHCHAFDVVAENIIRGVCHECVVPGNPRSWRRYFYIRRWSSVTRRYRSVRLGQLNPHRGAIVHSCEDVAMLQSWYQCCHTLEQPLCLFTSLCDWIVWIAAPCIAGAGAHGWRKSLMKSSSVKPGVAWIPFVVVWVL